MDICAISLKINYNCFDSKLFFLVLYLSKETNGHTAIGKTHTIHRDNFASILFLPIFLFGMRAISNLGNRDNVTNWKRWQFQTRWKKFSDIFIAKTSQGEFKAVYSTPEDRLWNWHPSDVTVWLAFTFELAQGKRGLMVIFEIAGRYISAIEYYKNFSLIL